MINTAYNNICRISRISGIFLYSCMQQDSKLCRVIEHRFWAPSLVYDGTHMGALRSPRGEKFRTLFAPHYILICLHLAKKGQIVQKKKSAVNMCVLFVSERWHCRQSKPLTLIVEVRKKRHTCIIYLSGMAQQVSPDVWTWEDNVSPTQRDKSIDAESATRGGNFLSTINLRWSFRDLSWWNCYSVNIMSMISLYMYNRNTYVSVCVTVIVSLLYYLPVWTY